MELIKNFGFDPYLFAAQIVNFLIVLYILKRFLYKPVLDLLKKRRNEVQEGLKNAEESKRLLDEAEKREKEILTKAQNEARKMVDEAKKESEELAQKLEEKARARTEKMISDATDSIAQQAKETEKRLTAKVGEIAVSMLEKSLKEFFGEKEQKELVSKAVRELKKQK